MITLRNFANKSALVRWCALDTNFPLANPFRSEWYQQSLPGGVEKCRFFAYSNVFCSFFLILVHFNILSQFVEYPRRFWKVPAACLKGTRNVSRGYLHNVSGDPHRVSESLCWRAPQHVSFVGFSSTCFQGSYQHVIRLSATKFWS